MRVVVRLWNQATQKEVHAELVMHAVLHSTNAEVSQTMDLSLGEVESNTAVPQKGERNLDTGSTRGVEVADATPISGGRLCSSGKAVGEGVTLEVVDIRRGFAHGRCRVEVSLETVTVFALGLHVHLGRQIVRGRLEVAGRHMDGGLRQEGQERYLY